MSEASDISVSLNVYEEDLNDETTCDLSFQELSESPKIKNNILCVLYLQNNKIVNLPDDFFPSLPSLMWLDLRNNLLIDLPKTIKNHACLTHLLLQNNKLTSLPNELGTVVNLKVLQLNGNPLMYPPRELVAEGVTKILNFLRDKFVVSVFNESQTDFDDGSVSQSENILSQGSRSYNSVLDEKLKNKTLSVQLNEKEFALESSDEEELYSKTKGKCPKLAKSRDSLPAYCQSSKYVKPSSADCKDMQNGKIKQSCLKDVAVKKHKDLLASREKIIQGRKNLEMLKTWRKNYSYRQLFADGDYRLHAKNYPYDTNPEYMTLLTREDIEKDLPDKYKKKLVRRTKPTVPRKSNNDVHLAMKIKKLFENLEAIDLNRENMTPRTEQKVLLSEIQKISEIKQKLMELSTTNANSVSPD